MVQNTMTQDLIKPHFIQLAFDKLIIKNLDNNMLFMSGCMIIRALTSGEKQCNVVQIIWDNFISKQICIR